MLRRHVLWPALTMAVVLAMAAALTSGCGDTGQAREYTERADELYDEAAAIAADLDVKKRQVVQALIDNDAARLISMEQDIASIPSETTRASDLAAQAEEEYKKILDLKGVDDYKKYASMMLEAIHMEKDALILGGDLATNVLGLLNEAEAGVPVDFQAYIKNLSGTINLLEQAEREIREIKREARNFAREKGLI